MNVLGLSPAICDIVAEAGDVNVIKIAPEYLAKALGISLPRNVT